MKRTNAEIILLTISVIWSATYVFTKIGLDFASPSAYLVIRFSVTLLILLSLFGKHLRSLNSQTACRGALLGLFFGIGFLLQTFALKVTTAEKAAFITGLCAVTTPIVGWIMEKRQIPLSQKIAIAIAIVGLLVLTHPDINNINYGDLLLLASTFCWSYYLFYVDKFTKSKEGGFARDANLILFTYFITLPITVFSALFIESGGFAVVFAPKLVISLAFNVIFASIGATFLQTRYQRYTTPARASMIFTGEPVFTSIIAFLTFGKPMSGLEMFGGAIMLMGITAMYFLPGMFRKFSRLVKYEK